MVFRSLFNYFVNNPQLIDKLAESYPIRRAAQLTVYALHKGKNVSQGSIQKIGSFTEKFQQEVKREWKEASENPPKKF